jgi:nucleoid-associated protein YgaU
MMNPIQYHLSYNNGAERLWLPVSPPSIRISSTHGYQDVEAAQLGEYTVIGKRKSSEYSFSSFFPRDYNPAFCAYTPVPNPWDCVEMVDRWMRSGNPMRLTIAGTPINAAVTIREFNYEPERGGSPGDIYYDIAFKEFLFVDYRRVSYEATNATIMSATTTRPDTEVPPSEYVVVDGDSLWKIAHRVYSDGDRWREIYSANESVIGPNPNLIFPGQTLVIP